MEGFFEKGCQSADGRTLRSIQGYYNPNVHESNLVDTNDTVLLYSPTQRPGALSFMVRPRGRVIAADSVYLTSDRSPLSKISDSYSQSAETEWNDTQRSIAGVNLFEPYPPALESLPAAGGSSVQVGGIQVPLWSLPLNPQRVLVPQRQYGVKTNNKRGFTPEPPILFTVGNQSGMSLEDAKHERYEGLVGRDDGMFLESKCTAISLRIEV